MSNLPEQRKKWLIPRSCLLYTSFNEEKIFIKREWSEIRLKTYILGRCAAHRASISFKNKKKVRKPQEEWYRVENNHEAIDVYKRQAFRRGRLIKVSKIAFFDWMAKGSDTVPGSDK